jgi:hypothetical protein
MRSPRGSGTSTYGRPPATPPRAPSASTRSPACSTAATTPPGARVGGRRRPSSRQSGSGLSHLRRCRDGRTPPVPERLPSYDDRREPMNGEDLIEMERAERRCGVCRSGRGWRRFEVVRPPGREPVLLCGSCRARFGDDPPIGRKHAPEPAPSDASPVPPPKPRAEKVQTRPGRDRLRTALRGMPGSFSTAMVARAAGLNKVKALARLHELERRGEVHRVGNRWSIGPSPDAVALAMDRLQARTSNVRIIRDRAPVS